MHSGVVMKITDKVIVLLCDDGKFRNIAHISPLPALGQRITVDVPSAKPIGVKAWTVWVAAASVLLCALGLSTLNQMWLRVAEPLAMVAVDINPSLMLGLDSQGVVVEVQRLNQDAKELVPRVAVLEGKSAEAALEVVMNLAEQQGYLAPEQGKDLVMVTVIADDKPEVVSQSRLQQKHQQYNIQVNRAKPQVVQEAKNMGLSVNKYLVYREAQKMGIGIRTKELKQKSVQETLRQKQVNPKRVMEQLRQKDYNHPEPVKQPVSKAKKKGEDKPKLKLEQKWEAKQGNPLVDKQSKSDDKEEQHQNQQKHQQAVKKQEKQEEDEEEGQAGKQGQERSHNKEHNNRKKSTGKD